MFEGETKRMTIKVSGKIRRIDGRQISYGEFRDKYMKTNEPILLTGLMDDWRACRDWVSPDGQPNLSFFSLNFAKSRVQVADCDRKEFTDQKRLGMTVAEYIEYWRDLNGRFYDADCDGNRNNSSSLYLKDWHFVKEYPDYNAYTTPTFFLDDWLNLYLDTYRIHGIQGVDEGGECDVSCSDYRFVYMGPKGTWTPLHADVFRSYSWSANVCGKKVWHFLSPSQSHLLYDRYMKQTVYDIYGDVSAAQFPGFSETYWLECIQDRNEIIFIPSGWFHQVKNVEDAISINHNWFNACNISWVWNLLIKDYNEAKEYIEDIRSISDDFESLCQRNLAANTGMNFDDFFVFITRMALANFTQLIDIMHSWEKRYSRNFMEASDMEKFQQLLFNLVSIGNVAQNMASIDYFDRYSKDYKFHLEDVAMLFVETGMSKDNNNHELDDALEKKCHVSQITNLKITNVDIVDEVDIKTSVSVLEGSEKSIYDKNSSKVQIRFFNNISSAMPEHEKPETVCSNLLVDGCLTKDCQVTVTNPKHLVQIIDDVIASVNEKALS